MINPKIFGMWLVIAVASIIAVTTISLQNATASQPCCPSDDDADGDVAETAEAGNVTTMMTNQTADGNMTDGTDSTS